MSPHLPVTSAGSGTGTPGLLRVPVSTPGGGAASYVSRVLGFGPIAYWPLYESSGTTAACLVNAAQNGTYSADVSLWPPGPGIGDGNTAPEFDGATEWVNIDTAALVAAFNGAEGSFLIWARVFNVGGTSSGCV